MTLFIVCFGIGAGFTIISFLFGHLDFAHFGHFDAAHTDVSGAHFDSGSGGGPHFHLSSVFAVFRPVTLSLFLVVFGACGIMLTRMAVPFAYALLIGVVAGAFCVLLLLKLVLDPLTRAQNTTALSNEELMWNAARVSVRIPVSGYGEITYTIRDSVGRGPAGTRQGQPIEVGENVIIEDIRDSVFYVAKIASDEAKANIMQK